MDVPMPRAHEETSVAVPGGPRAMPILGWRGNALRFFRNPIAYMTLLRQRYGDVAQLVQGGNQTLFFRARTETPSTVFAFGPSCNRAILTDLETFANRMAPGPKTKTFQRLGTNVLFLDRERHKQQRKLLMAAFTRERLRSYYDTIVHYTTRQLDAWQGRDQVEICTEMGELSLNIGSKIFYGLDATRKGQDLATLMCRMLDTLFSPATMIPIDLPGTPYRRLIRIMEEINDRLQEEIEAKRREGTVSDVLSMMVRAHDEDSTQLTADELVGEAFVMFFAGHDTTAKALAWSLFLLAQHPDAVVDLLDELEALVPDGIPTFEQIYELPVLDRTVKECLRLLGPAIMFAREATCDTELGSYPISAGSEVIYSPYMTHRDPEIFAEPTAFRPRRWEGSQPSAYEYLPFGAGARMCLGASLGALQVRLILAMLLQRFRFKVVPGTRIDIKTNVVMTPSHGIPMLIHAQDRQLANSRSHVKGYIREMVDLS